MLKTSMIVLTAGLYLAVADTVPAFDIDANCRASTRAADGTGERMAACRREETAARDQLTGVWTLAKAATRETCLGTQSQGSKSYVALMTCMQIAEGSLPWKK
jgi:hypothetical protein